MSLQKYCALVFFCVMFFSQILFSQITVEGTVTDMGSAPIQNALVELIDQADSTRKYSDTTNEQGRYIIEIVETEIGDHASQIPRTCLLLQNYPNPFNPSTMITYELPRALTVQIDIYNVLGQKIKTLFNGFQANLSGQFIWDATDELGQGVSAGVYFCVLKTDDFRTTRKMLLVDGHSSYSNAVPSQANQSGQLVLNKKASNNYLFRVSGTDIETYEQQNVVVTADMVFNVTVMRAVKDVDGNTYRTVKIGDQRWLAENLKVTHFRNGDIIPNVTETTAWFNLGTGAFCHYQNDENISAIFGPLYNWYAVDDNRYIAPIGWHVASDADWKVLEIFLGMDQENADQLGGRGFDGSIGNKLKEIDSIHWDNLNTDATNESGFTALPGGFLGSDGYTYLNSGAVFWTATEFDNNGAFNRALYSGSPAVYRFDNIDKAFGLSVRCVQNAQIAPTAPILSSPPNESINMSSDPILSWNADPFADSYRLQVSKLSDFSVLAVDQHEILSPFYQVSGLSADTKYYWRVCATNASGTSSWSNVWSFTVISTDLITDIDGNIYKIVKIGQQWWMAENFKVTHYRNGDTIPNVTGTSEWFQQNNGAYCYYDNEVDSAATWGCLYNWYTVKDSRGLAPQGWHIPSDAEWKELEVFLGMPSGEVDLTGWRSTDVGSKLKETGTSHWAMPNTDATNESGFTALPAGCRFNNGSFWYIKSSGIFWTTDSDGPNDAFYRYLTYDNPGINRNAFLKTFGLSLRCVKD